MPTLAEEGAGRPAPTSGDIDSGWVDEAPSAPAGPLINVRVVETAGHGINGTTRFSVVIVSSSGGASAPSRPAADVEAIDSVVDDLAQASPDNIDSVVDDLAQGNPDAGKTAEQITLAYVSRALSDPDFVETLTWLARNGRKDAEEILQIAKVVKSALQADDLVANSILVLSPGIVQQAVLDARARRAQAMDARQAGIPGGGCGGH